jgi:hypothetical protein
VTEYRWYVREFTPVGPGNAFLDSGPPARVTTKSLAGTGTNYMPPQVAFALTEKTAWPKHWGRTYLPTPQGLHVFGDRWTSACVDTIVGAANTLYQGLAAAEFFPVVPVTQVASDPARALVGITQVQGDDIPDVIRRRRPRNTTYRKVLP